MNNVLQAECFVPHMINRLRGTLVIKKKILKIIIKVRFTYKNVRDIVTSIITFHMPLLTAIIFVKRFALKY